MKNMLSFFTLVTILILGANTFAADKVIVIPLCGKEPAGDVVAADVLEGRTFSNGDDVGVIGTMPDNGAVAITPGTSSQTVPAGFHDGSGMVSGDTDLVTGNVRAGVNIFGVTGNSNVVNTSSGDAASAHIKFGKKAWVDGSEITGYLAGGTSCNPGATYSPLKRWVNNGNGTITDTTTGLIWYHRGNQVWGAYERVDKCDPLSMPFPTVPANISNMSHLNPVDLTDGSSGFDWRLPTVNEMLEITSGVEAISPSTQYLFSGIQTGWYWTCNASTNPIPMKFMKVQMPETNGFGVEENIRALHWALAVRSP